MISNHIWTWGPLSSFNRVCHDKSSFCRRRCESGSPGQFLRTSRTFELRSDAYVTLLFWVRSPSLTAKSTWRRETSISSIQGPGRRLEKGRDPNLHFGPFLSSFNTTLNSIMPHSKTDKSTSRYSKSLLSWESRVHTEFRLEMTFVGRSLRERHRWLIIRL